MSKSRSIPKELIKVKANEIWKKRRLEGKDGTPEKDWIEARQYLEKHRWVIFLWNVNTPVRSLGNFWSLFREPNSRDFALEIVKTLGIGLTAFGLLFSVWEGLEERRLTQERLITERRMTQERLITDSFSKAVEQLGKDKDRTVRIGGIYALERIAKYYDKDHWTIMEVLTSYVRENSSLPSELKQYPKNVQEQELRLQKQNELPEVSIDVQAVLTVIVRREDPEPDRDETIDLSFTNLRGANLFLADLRSANLRDADLESADLESADLRSAKLRGANLRDADLESADLESASLYRANLIEARNLTRSQIKSACYWEKAIYKGHWDDEQYQWVIDEEANQQYIDQLKKDKASEPKEPVDCRRWKTTR